MNVANTEIVIDLNQIIPIVLSSIVLIGKGKRGAMAIYSVGVICLFVLAYLAIHGSFA